MLRSAKLAPVFDYAVLERFWRQSDDLGFHAVWDYDHFYGLRDETSPADREKIADKLAKIVSGASPEFLLGFVKGFLLGVWEGITDPLKLIWMVIEGLNYVTSYLADLKAQYGDAPGLSMVSVVLRELAERQGERARPGSARDPQPDY